VLQQNVKRYKIEFEEEWEKVYQMLHKNKYDHIIPGISDPANKA